MQYLDGQIKVTKTKSKSGNRRFRAHLLGFPDKPRYGFTKAEAIGRIVISWSDYLVTTIGRKAALGEGPVCD